MDQDFIRFGLAAFVTLLVVVDPPGVVPIFVALTKDEQPARRRKILIRAVLIAFGVALFFLIAGRAVLSYLGVTVHAFAISGGILLFATAMPMLFGQRGGLQAPDGRERGSMGQDISFSRWHPMLSGRFIATILLLTRKSRPIETYFAGAVSTPRVLYLYSCIWGARLMRPREGGVHMPRGME